MNVDLSKSYVFDYFLSCLRFCYRVTFRLLSKPELRVKLPFGKIFFIFLTTNMMMQKIQTYLPFIAIIELLIVIGFSIGILLNKRNYQSELLRINAERKSSIDSLVTLNTLSNNLILAQSSALQFSSEQNLTKNEIQDLKFKTSVIDTANLTYSYEQALRSVNSYLEDRKQQKRFNDSLRVLQAHRNK